MSEIDRGPPWGAAEWRVAALEGWREGHVAASNNSFDELRERITALEARLDEIRDEVEIRLADRFAKQRAVDEALLTWFERGCGPGGSQDNLVAALREALK
jgi:hypothetical protein